MCVFVRLQQANKPMFYSEVKALQVLPRVRHVRGDHEKPRKLPRVRVQVWVVVSGVWGNRVGYGLGLFGFVWVRLDYSVIVRPSASKISFVSLSDISWGQANSRVTDCTSKHALP